MFLLNLVSSSSNKTKAKFCSSDTAKERVVVYNIVATGWLVSSQSFISIIVTPCYKVSKSQHAKVQTELYSQISIVLKTHYMSNFS